MLMIIPSLIELGDLKIELHVPGKYCIFAGDSGSGKTYLFECLKQWCVLNDRKIKVFDYVERPKWGREDIEKYNELDVLIFDNAELYFKLYHQTLLARIHPCIFISSLRDYIWPDELYTCKYTPGKIEVRHVDR